MERPDFENPFVAPEGESEECRKLREAHANAKRIIYFAELGSKFILACVNDDKSYLPENDAMYERLGLNQNDPDSIQELVIITKDYAQEFVGEEIDEMKQEWKDQVDRDDPDVPF